MLRVNKHNARLCATSRRIYVFDYGAGLTRSTRPSISVLARSSSVAGRMHSAISLGDFTGQTPLKRSNNALPAASRSFAAARRFAASACFSSAVSQRYGAPTGARLPTGSICPALRLPHVGIVDSASERSVCGIGNRTLPEGLALYS